MHRHLLLRAIVLFIAACDSGPVGTQGGGAVRFTYAVPAESHVNIWAMYRF